MVGKNQNSGLKKGPWSAEEDEILLNFVNTYGPKDWSSIRSNGLLPRTGKSCRLRWVNKLRPNLKVGCKFTAEEERVVVELQAKFGNRWAKIASYLEGRTDNDVKNFWSSRKKRLARMLMSSTSQASNIKCQKRNKHKSALIPQVPSNLQVSETSNCSIQVTEPSSSYNPSDQSSFGPSDTKAITTIPVLAGSVSSPARSSEPNREAQMPDPLWFPQLPSLAPQRESPSIPWCTSLTCGHEIKDLEPIFAEPISCLELFPGSNGSHLNGDIVADIDFGLPFFGGLMEGSSSRSGIQGDTGENLANPDGFFEDFPIDVFDSLDPLPEFATPDC